MADKKTYSIHIDGIKQSIDGVENLGKAVESTSKSFDDYARVVNKLQQYKEAYAKLEEAQFKKEIKNQYELKQARETVAAGMGKTYAEQQKYLTALGKVIKNTEGDVSGLIKEYNELNNKLKQVDATMGNHQRNVGNYESALGKFNKPFSGIVNVTKSAISAFQLYNGVMTAFGASTEESTKAMEKLMSTMSIIQSLNELNNTLKQGSVMGNLFTKAMNAMALGIQGTTTATKALRVALISLGIGAIIVLVTTLITHWEELCEWFNKTFPILNQLGGLMNTLKASLAGLVNAIANIFNDPVKAFKEGFQKQVEKGLEEISRKQAAEEDKQLTHHRNMITKQKNADGTYRKEYIEANKKMFENRKKMYKEGSDEYNKVLEDEARFYQQVEDAKLSASKKTLKEISKDADERKKIAEQWTKAELKAIEEIEKERQKVFEAEKKRLENLKKLRDKDQDAEYAYQKQKLKLDLAYAESEEEKIRIKKEIIALDQKIAEENAKAAAADTMGISIDELEQRLTMTDEKWMGLNEEQKQVLQTLITQLATIKMAAEEAKQGLSGSSTSSSSSSSSEKEKKNPYTQKWHELIYGGDGTQDEMSEKAQQLAEAVGTAYQETIGPIFDGVMNLGDAIHQAMEFAIEEAENALEEAEEKHDAAVEKVEESKDRISEINDKMKDSSGAQLEAYKTQMAEEMLLLQQREQEERRLQKEKEKREKELEKQKKKQRKLELQQQLIQAIVSGALAVVNGLATQPFMPVGIAMGALAGVATAIQIATITKQISKLADGGLLNGKSHAQGGIPVGNTGIEVEGGEYIVNKRSTAKYLPLLQQINEEGARKKTVANQIGKYANGGELNYERINSNLDAMNTAKMVSAAISGIEMHPVVSVVDINRGQKDLVEVRQLAGAKD